MNSEIKKENKNVRFSFRMTPAEAAQLDAAAKKLNWKPSDFARNAVSAAVVATDQTVAA